VDDVLDIALLVSEILERLGVAHMVAGSLASSLHGIPRATQNIDLVADLSEKQIEPLVDALADAFYVDAGAVREAVRDGTRFNAIHLDTVFKVDIYMPTRGRRGRIELDRARPYFVSEDPLAQVGLPRSGGSSTNSLPLMGRRHMGAPQREPPHQLVGSHSMRS
jgi:hypothetical protein